MIDQLKLQEEDDVNIDRGKPSDCSGETGRSTLQSMGETARGTSNTMRSGPRSVAASETNMALT